MAVDWTPERAYAAVRRGAWLGVLSGAEAVATTGTRHITSGGRTGRIYTRRGVKHQASAPGEPPASDTGRLAGSVRLIPDEARLICVINWSTKYALPLEVGTARMAPRPYARRSLDENRKVINDAVAAGVRGQLAT